MPAKQFVRDLKDKQLVHTVFLAGEKQILRDKNGEAYLSLDLFDNSGTVQGRMWERSAEISRVFQSGDFVRIKGHVQFHQNRKQIVIHDLLLASTSEFRPEDFLRASSRNTDEMYLELQEHLEEIVNPHLKRALSDLFSDVTITSRLKLMPGQRESHGFLGGLLEHILSVMNLVQAMADNYPHLSKDLLLFGALTRNLGKIWELQVGEKISTTDEGRMLGAQTLSYDWFSRIAGEITGFPKELGMICKHIILCKSSQDSQLPVIPEGVCLETLENFDRQMAQMTNFMKDELTSGQKWTRPHEGLGRSFFLEVLRDQLKDL